MLMILVVGWIVWTAFFLVSEFGSRRSPSAIRPAIRWIWAGTMLIYGAVTFGVVAERYGWMRSHRAIGGVGLALVIAGPICIGVGVFKVRRRSHADRQKVSGSA